MSRVPVIFRILNHGPASGDWNMAIDEAILETMAGIPAEHPQAVLRFYTWEAATLSLGYFQSAEERVSHQASRKCPMVRRSSGGGAIVHDRELTYSLTISSGFHQSTQSTHLYHVVHASLIRALSHWGIQAEQFVPSQASSAAPRTGTFLCFQRRAPGDVILGDIKIAGSAQRKRRTAVMQHGSVLLAQSEFAPELPGIWERTGRQIPADALRTAWLATLQDELGWESGGGEMSTEMLAVASRLQTERFAAAAWNEKR